MSVCCKAETEKNIYVFRVPGNPFLSQYLQLLREKKKFNRFLSQRVYLPPPSKFFASLRYECPKYRAFRRFYDSILEISAGPDTRSGTRPSSPPRVLCIYRFLYSTWSKQHHSYSLSLSVSRRAVCISIRYKSVRRKRARTRLHKDAVLKRERERDTMRLHNAVSAVKLSLLSGNYGGPSVLETDDVVMLLRLCCRRSAGNVRRCGGMRTVSLSLSRYVAIYAMTEFTFLQPLV